MPRLIIAGPAKVGKTTFGASMPKPNFERTEDGTNGMDVDAFDVLPDYTTCLEQLRWLAKGEHQYQTLVIDALDGLERLIWSQVVLDHNAANPAKPIKSIEDIGFAKGYIFALTYWQRLVSALTYLRDQGMAICMLCHTHQRRVSPPDMEEFERYEPRIHHKALGLLVEWADLIGFAQLETRTKATESGKRQGVTTGRRMLHCSESAAYVAGNRYGIESSLPLAWDELSPLLGISTTTANNKE
jgi:hypothetical protein